MEYGFGKMDQFSGKMYILSTVFWSYWILLMGLYFMSMQSFQPWRWKVKSKGSLEDKKKQVPIGWRAILEKDVRSM